ncbi:6479_t:CDS:2, partial [Racocetra fulgida]
MLTVAQKLPEILKKKTKTKGQNSLNPTDNVDFENTTINILFEEFDEDEILQIDVELPDFDANDNDSVMEEFFDIKTFEKQNTIEE